MKMTNFETLIEKRMMKKKIMIVLVSAFLLLSAFSCGGGNKANSTSEQNEKIVVNVPQFDADSAYLYVKNQVDFGPRVPNTKGHVACGNYLAKQLKDFGAQVTDQYHKTPILGANDGASGVGALLEIARLVNQRQPELGIDIIFLDAEDYGTHDQNNEESWCLGAQYWARNPHVQGYNARFGILLDMVGGENTVFLKESYSERFAPDINKKVWKAAKKLGYGKMFIDEDGGGVTDDHLFINRLARIKTIDIIASDPEGGFTPTWHTINDNMEHIDRNTLKAVGQTVLEVIYNEK